MAAMVARPAHQDGAAFAMGAGDRTMAESVHSILHTPSVAALSPLTKNGARKDRASHSFGTRAPSARNARFSAQSSRTLRTGTMTDGERVSVRCAHFPISFMVAPPCQDNGFLAVALDGDHLVDS